MRQRLLGRLAAGADAYLAVYVGEVTFDGCLGEVQRRGLRGVIDDLTGASRFVPGVTGAAFIVVIITSAAPLLLVVPGVWLYTRWSLTTPVIREESVGPLAAMRRSRELVRGNF